MYHTVKKKFSEVNVQFFLYLLNQVTWQEVYTESDLQNSVLS
jgi:hypothetical protein